MKKQMSVCWCYTCSPGFTQTTLSPQLPPLPLPHFPPGQGGDGADLFIFHNWKFTPLSTVLICPYSPPGQFGSSTEELDMWLSSILENGCPFIIMDDLNIHFDKLQDAEFLSLLTSFNLELLQTPSTHKAGNKLDLILTHITENTLVATLHTSNHFFVQFSMTLPTQPCPPYLSLPPTSLPLYLPSSSWSILIITWCHRYTYATLTTWLNTLCPLFQVCMCYTLQSLVVWGLHTVNRAAERMWHKTRDPIYQSLIFFYLLLQKLSLLAKQHTTYTSLNPPQAHVHSTTTSPCAGHLMTGLPTCTVKPLQRIQKAAVHLVFNQP